jgi:hypothetical protein
MCASTPPAPQLSRGQFGPHLQDGPHLQAICLVAHLQVGAQVHGLHLQVSVMDELLLVVEFVGYDANRFDT